MFQQVYKTSIKLSKLENSFHTSLNSNPSRILQTIQQLVIPSRNTYVFQRKKELRLVKKNQTKPRLGHNAYIYDVIEHESSKRKEDINVVLTTYIKGLGQQGDCVKVKRYYAYANLLVPGLADYATPENVQYWKSVEVQKTDKTDMFSSVHVERTIGYLKRRTFSIVMNKETEWTLEPWHVKVSLRKAGVHVTSEDCITLPPEKIQGPNIDLEGKEFYVTLTINKKNNVEIRCRIHHWSTDPIDRLPYVQDHWLQPAEKIFGETSHDKTSPA